jgi:hypothetical protein
LERSADTTHFLGNLRSLKVQSADFFNREFI